MLYRLLSISDRLERASIECRRRHTAIPANDDVDDVTVAGVWPDRSGRPIAEQQAVHMHLNDPTRQKQPHRSFDTQHVAQRHSHCTGEQRTPERQVGQANCTHANHVVPDGAVSVVGGVYACHVVTDS
jgi:hypothetical protein